MENTGTAHAFKYGMLHCSRSENVGRLRVGGKCRVGYGLKAACIVFLLGSLSAAQMTSGSLGKQATSAGHATVSSAIAAINLSAVLPATVGVSVSDVPLLVSIRNPGTATDIIRVPITSFWHLGASSTGVELVAYFDSPQQALVDAEGHAIPSTRVQGGISGGATAPFSENSSAGTLGGSRTLYRQPVSQNNFSGSRKDVIEISVAPVSDLGLPSGTYGGTLRLRVVAY
jgi:hypothetical protein